MKRISLKRISKKKQKGFMTKQMSLTESGDSSLADHDSPALTSDDQPSDDAVNQLTTPQKFIRGKQRSKRRQLRQYINAMSPISKRKDSVEKLAEAETRQTLGSGLLQLEELITDEETGRLRVRSEVEDVETPSRVGRSQKRSLGSPSYLVSSSEEFGYVSREISDSDPPTDRRSLIAGHGSPGKVLIRSYSVDMDKETIKIKTHPKEVAALNTDVQNPSRTGELIKQQSLPESSTYSELRSPLGRYEKRTHKSPRKQLKISRAYKSVEMLSEHVRQYDVAKNGGKYDINYKEVIRANATTKKKNRNLLKYFSLSGQLSPTSQWLSRSQENLLHQFDGSFSTLNQNTPKRGVKTDRKYRSQENLLNPGVELHHEKKCCSKSVDDLTSDVNDFSSVRPSNFMTQQSVVRTRKVQDEHEEPIRETHFISNKKKSTICKGHSPTPIEAVVKINNYSNQKPPSVANNKTSKETAFRNKSTKLQLQIRHNHASKETGLNSSLFSPEKQHTAEDDSLHEDNFVDVIMHDEKLNDVNTAQASREEVEDRKQQQTSAQDNDHMNVPLGKDFIAKSHRVSQGSLLSPVKQKLGLIFTSPKKLPKLKKLADPNSDLNRVERSKSAATAEQLKNKNRLKRKRNKTLQSYDKVEVSEDDNVFESNTSLDDITSHMERKTVSQKNTSKQHRHSNRISQALTSIFKSPTHSKSKVLELDLDLILKHVKEETHKEGTAPDVDHEKMRSERKARIAEIEEEKQKHEEEIRKLELEAHNIQMIENAEVELARNGKGKNERVELNIRGAFMVNSDSDDSYIPSTTTSPSKVMMQVKRRFSSMKQRSALKRYNLDGYSVEQTSWRRNKETKIRRAVSLKTDKHPQRKRQLRSPQKMLEDFLTSEGKLKSSNPRVNKKDHSSNPDGGWLAITHSPDRNKPPKIIVYQQESRGSKSLIQQMQFPTSDEILRIPTLGFPKKEDEKKKKRQRTILKRLSGRKDGISTDIVPRRRLFGRNSIVASDWDKVTDFGGMPSRRVNSAEVLTLQTDDPTPLLPTRPRSTSALSGHYDVKGKKSGKEKRGKISDDEKQTLGKELVVQLFDWSERSSLRKDSVDEDYVEMNQIHPSSVMINKLEGQSNVIVVEKTPIERKSEVVVVEDTSPLEQKLKFVPEDTTPPERKSEVIVVEDTTPPKRKSDVIVLEDTTLPKLKEDDNKLTIRNTEGKRERHKTRSPAKVLSGIFNKIIHGSPGKEGGLLRRGSSLRKSKKEVSSLPTTPTTDKNIKTQKSKKRKDSKTHFLLVPGQQGLSSSLQNLVTFKSSSNDDSDQKSHAHCDITSDDAVQHGHETSEHQHSKKDIQIDIKPALTAEDPTYVDMKGHLSHGDNLVEHPAKPSTGLETSVATMVMEMAEESDYSPVSKFNTISVFSKFAPEGMTNREDTSPEQLEDSYHGDVSGSLDANRNERSSHATTQKPMTEATNRLVGTTERVMPVTSQVKETDPKSQHDDVTHSQPFKEQRKLGSGSVTPDQFDYEEYFQGGSVPIESRRDYVTENWKHFYDVNGHGVKEDQLSPRKLRQLQDHQNKLMTRLLGGQEGFKSDVTKPNMRTKPKRPSSMEQALVDLMEAVRISNRENFEEQSYKKEVYKKVVEIEHGQCSLSVPYIAVEKLPASSLYENGDIYASDSKEGCIDVYSTRGQHKSTLTVPGRPGSLAASESGHVLCTSHITGQVYVIDVVHGSVLRKIGHIEHSRHPRYVTMHPDNRAFVTSDIRFLGNWNINIFDLRTGFLSLSIAPSSHVNIRVKWPGFLAFRQHTDQLYVSDSESHCLFVYDVRRASRPVFQIGEKGTGEGELCNPCGVTYIPGDAFTLDSTQRGPVVVADWGNNRISAFDAITGQFEGHVIDDDGQTKNKVLQSPYDITTDVRGWIYTTESKTKNIKVFKPA